MFMAIAPITQKFNTSSNRIMEDHFNAKRIQIMQILLFLQIAYDVNFNNCVVSRKHSI